MSWTAPESKMILDLSSLSCDKSKITISARAIQPDGQDHFNDLGLTFAA